MRTTLLIKIRKLIFMKLLSYPKSYLLLKRSWQKVEQNFLRGSIVRRRDWHCAQAHPWLVYANASTSNTCFVLGVFTNWTHSSIRRRVKYASLDTKASMITPSCSAPSSRGLVLYLHGQDIYIQYIISPCTSNGHIANYTDIFAL